jgi:hypothetical protein
MELTFLGRTASRGRPASDDGKNRAPPPDHDRGDAAAAAALAALRARETRRERYCLKDDPRASDITPYSTSDAPIGWRGRRSWTSARPPCGGGQQILLLLRRRRSGPVEAHANATPTRAGDDDDDDDQPDDEGHARRFCCLLSPPVSSAPTVHHLLPTLPPAPPPLPARTQHSAAVPHGPRFPRGSAPLPPASGWMDGWVRWIWLMTPRFRFFFLRRREVSTDQ